MIVDVDFPQLKEAHLSSAQSEALEWIHRYGATGGNNKFLQSTAEFYLHPLGVAFKTVNYDFFSALEANSYPSLREVVFDGRLVEAAVSYTGLYQKLAELPEKVKLQLVDGLPSPVLDVDSSKLCDRKSGRADLFELGDVDKLAAIIGSGVIEEINGEISMACVLMKTTLDLGFRMLLDPADGDVNSRAFISSRYQYFVKVKDQLVKDQLWG